MFHARGVRLRFQFSLLPSFYLSHHAALLSPPPHPKKLYMTTGPKIILKNSWRAGFASINNLTKF